MGEYEASTLDTLKAHREDLVDPNITEHEERVFKLMGDGALAEFPGVVEVVKRAEGIQRRMAERTPPVERIRAARGVLERDGM
jgi:adenylate cyclase